MKVQMCRRAPQEEVWITENVMCKAGVFTRRTVFSAYSSSAFSCRQCLNVNGERQHPRGLSMRIEIWQEFSPSALRHACCAWQCQRCIAMILGKRRDEAQGR